MLCNRPRLRATHAQFLVKLPAIRNRVQHQTMAVAYQTSRRVLNTCPM
jgi:hypothetical protein